jgi:EF hand
MLFRFSILIIVFMVATLSLGRYSYGHDCPLWQMGRLETFRNLDKDKDGRLNLQEFMAQGWCQDVPSCQCQEAARQFFQRLDQNQDGFITLEEHQAFAKEMQGVRK